jgi:UDP-N-acetylglucosamine 1-carboxyvinyltransferase
MNAGSSNWLCVTPSELRPVHIQVTGYKNALVPIIAASVALGQETQLSNVPRIDDTFVLGEILSRAGARVVASEDTLRLEPDGLGSPVIPPDLSRRIHGSLYLIPAYLSHFGAVEFRGAGGCTFSDRNGVPGRPVQHMLSVLERFGASFVHRDGCLYGSASGFRPCDIDIMDYTDSADLNGPYVSGATKTAILAAAAATEGTSTIRHPYSKPDVLELLAYLRAAGHDVDHRGQTIHITPGRLHTPVSYSLISDISQIMTFVACSIFHRVPLTLERVTMPRAREGLRAELRLLEAMRVPLVWTEETLSVGVPDQLASTDIDVTGIGIYSDHQPFFALMLLRGEHRARIREFVWKDRFGYARELVKLGAAISLGDGWIEVFPSRLRGTPDRLVAGDLRAAAVLVLAALAADSETWIENAEHLTRGYPKFVDDLRRLGARIAWEPESKR